MQAMAKVSLVLSNDQIQSLIERYATPSPILNLSYGTVQDFCDSSDHLSFLSNIQGDLKDLQRPSALKLILSLLPQGSSLLEIGAGEPHVAHALARLGYAVTVVDPYDGSGRGPIEYQHYVEKYPEVNVIRSTFSDALTWIQPHSIDCVYSISVLEHVHQFALVKVFAGIRRYLRPGGYSLHLIDHVLAGDGQEFHRKHLAEIVLLQGELEGNSPSESAGALMEVLGKAAADIDTYYLSAEGHNRWRGAVPYSSFRYRRVISIASCSKHKGTTLHDG
jgi:SAM-dependent methyltransferase